MIIQCPECGGQVSDKAQVCVHCGYRFRVCPDCGKILADNVTACPSCGYSFSAMPNRETAEQSPVAPQADASVTPYALWLRKDPKAQIMNRTIAIGKWSLFALGSVLLVAALIVYFSWTGTTEVEKIFTAQKTQSTLAVLGAIGLILAGDITVFDQLQNVVRWKMGAIWLRRTKIPAEDMLAEISKANRQRKDIPDKEMTQFNDSVSMAYLAACPQKTGMLVTGLVVQFVLWIAFAVLSGFLMRDFASYLVLKELEPETVFGESAILYLIFMALIFVIGRCVVFAFHIGFSKGQERWFDFITKNRGKKE